jgi:membrane fusion protein (multidrug efflux system)
VLLATSIASLVHAQQPPVSVELAPVTTRHLRQEVPLVATVEAVRRSIVAAEQEGLVIERLFEEGAAVRAGQELVRTDTELSLAQRRVVDAAAASARGQLGQAQAELENALAEFYRIEQLRKQGVVTEKEFRDIETIRRVSQARVLARQAEVQEQESQLQRLDLIVAKSVVKAPFDGMVAIKRAEVGQWLAQGDPVAEVVSTDPIHISVAVPEKLISRVTAGAKFDVTIDALPGETLTGEVDRILPVADNASRTFTVKLKVPNADQRLRPGFFARVILASPDAKEVIAVPRSAVVTRGRAFFVVAAREGKAVVVPVTYDTIEGSDAMVTGDLKPGEQVVVRGNEALMGGESLVPVTLAGQK